MQRRIAALLPSLTDVMFLMPLVFLFARLDGATDLLEGDTGWHLRTGDWMIANGRVPYVDMFSYTKPGETWYAWEWLWDLAFAFLHQHYGMAAVIFASLVVLCITSALLFRLTLRLCPYRLPAALFTFLAMAASTLHWWARPHLFTWLFMVMAMWVLEWKRTGERNLLWTLPLLTVLWVNVHGGFFVILLLLGSYAAGEIAAGLVDADREQRAALMRRSVPYLVTMAGCLVASLVNPYTYHLHQHIFRYIADPDSPFFRNVGEWQSISFHSPVARYVEVLIVASVAASFWQAAHRRFACAFLALGWMHLGLISGRHLPIFAIAAAPMTAQAAVEAARRLAASGIAGWIKGVLAWVKSADLEFAQIDRMPRIYLSSLAGLVLIGAGLWSPAAGEKLRPDYSEKRYPVKALNKLTEEQLAGRVFTDDEWGDYLIYRRYPKAKVYIDGRFDFYGRKMTEEYMDIIGGKYDWQQKLDKFQIDAILLPVTSQMTATLKESGRWRPVYDDGVAILFHSRERIARRGVQPSPGSSDPAKPVRAGGERSRNCTGKGQTL